MFLVRDGKVNWKAVVGISVGGLLVFSIYLWNSARLKVETRAIVRYLVSLKAAREESVKLHSEDKDILTEKGPNGSKFKVENGVGKKNSSFFWITVTLDSTSLCRYLAEEEVGAIRIDKVKCSSRKEVTFYFSKFKTNTKGSPDMQNQPDACPANAECDEEFNITKCYFGFYKSEKKCKPCPEKSTNCEGETFECQIGYRALNDDCVSCGEGVRSCNENGEPTECLERYYSIDGKCVSCSTLGPGYCDQGSSGGSVSGVGGRSSSSGYSPIYSSGNQRRSSSSSNTRTSSLVSNSSDKCIAGYYKSSSGCLKCSDGYYSADGATSCTPCAEGYVSNSTHTACVKNVDCQGMVKAFDSSDENINLTSNGNTVVLSYRDVSDLITISDNLEFSGCDLVINTPAETHLLGNIFAKNLTINSSGYEIFTYDSESTDYSPSGKKIICSGDFKINGPFYSNAGVYVSGNLMMTSFNQVGSSEVKISGYVSGEDLVTDPKVLSPIKVGRYVSVSGRVHNVQSDDSITASVISAGEADGGISVAQIQATGKVISKNGDIVVSDEREGTTDSEQYTFHVDYGAEVSAPKGTINIMAGSNVLNMGTVSVGRNMNVNISEYFRNWNKMMIGGDLTITGNVRFAGVKRSNSMIGSQTTVCGSINGSGDIQVDTVASLSVGKSISDSFKTRVIQYEGACEEGKGELLSGHANYYIQNYATRVKGSECNLIKLEEEGPFVSAEQGICQKMSWCQQNRYCY